MPKTTVQERNQEHINELEAEFTRLLKEPEQFLCAQPEKYKELSQLLQRMYQLAVNSYTPATRFAEMLPKLVLKEMHEEQIWQQLELRNNVMVPVLTDATTRMITTPEEELAIRLVEDSGVEEEESEGGIESEDSSVNMDSEETYQEHDRTFGDEYDDSAAKISKPRKKLRVSVVDDKFFKLGEMEAFLEAEETREIRKQKGKTSMYDDGIDFFAESFGEDEYEKPTNPQYKDFFGSVAEEETEISQENEKSKRRNKPRSNAVNNAVKDNDSSQRDCAYKFVYKENEESDNESSEADEKHNHGSQKESPESGCAKEAVEQPKSSFEIRQDRMKQRIQDYEDEVLGEKRWQLKGEIKASNRPQNSLLEEILEFESTTRPAPIITQETTRRLEDIIRQRIKDKAWDDVELKVKPLQTPQEFRKQLVLDQEKSKQSLAQIYEKEYQNELEKLEQNHGDKEKEEPKEHKEIRNMMRALFIKLDALSNFHFTPKPVAPEARIITNTPAANMEEVAPVAVSDAKLLAPEEVLKPTRYALIGKTERTKTDKNRERRKKKQKQRAIHKALKARELQEQKLGGNLSKKETNAKLLKKVTKNRNVQKITASSDHGSLKSSKAFFSRLQDTTLATATTKKKNAEPQSISAKKLKL